MLIQVEPLGENFWSQPQLRHVKTGMVFVDINLGEGVPDWHTTTSEGEPLARIRKDIVFEIVERQAVTGDALDAIFVNREATHEEL